jgi:aspartate-semialdehyde dehydrogenase
MTESKSAPAAEGASLKKRVKRPFKVAVVGATGLVGREVISILEERGFPVSELSLFASERSAGESIDFGDDSVTVRVLSPELLQGVEIAFFAAGGSVSRAVAPEAAKAGVVCIDKSSTFRTDVDVPLVVPGVNDEALAGWDTKRIIATPNCSTIQLVQALKPLHDIGGLRRVICCTYQAASGAGREGIDELDHQVRDMFNSRDAGSTEVFGARLAFNALPCIPGDGAFDDDGYTGEERKMVGETRRILGLPDLKVGVTCARVPVFHGHSEAVHIELDKAIDPEIAREALRAAPGVLVVDDPNEALYPTAADAVGQDHTLVGRVRVDPSLDNGLAFWVVSDNLRTGAALNAVRIAEHLGAEHLA